MIPADLNWLKHVLDVPYDGQNRSISGINTDTRSITAGEVFIALRGPNFDGHKFLQAALDAGAVAAVVDTPQPIAIPQFVVADTRLALGKVGKANKAALSVKTVAITGSAGKTTVKEMCASILGLMGKVLATQGNFNNDIGVPLTLLRLAPEHDYAVIELGANHIGEIAYTSNLTQPDVAVITNIGPAHLEGFGSMQGIAQAKGEIYSGLKANGVAVVNVDSEFADFWLPQLAGINTLKFSKDQSVSVHASDVVIDHAGFAHFTLHINDQAAAVALPLPGGHNVANALAAASVCFAIGAPLATIVQGLMTMQPVKGRVNRHQLRLGLTVIDDTYNASVGAVNAAIDLLACHPGHRVLVFGDMAELGQTARQYHEQIGQYALDKGIDELLTLGVLSQCASDVYEQHGWHFSSREMLIQHIWQRLSQLPEPVTILVKGSRSSRMELIVQALLESDKGAKDASEAAC